VSEDRRTVAGQADLNRRGVSSALRTLEECLGGIEAWQPFTNAFSQVWASEASDLARDADAAAEEGRDLGELHGVPVAVKDLFAVSGHVTSGCCAVYADNTAGSDAEVVTRLRSAGAVIVGKTNQHELAMGATNRISACGPTGNPFDPDRITGGSSGGSGAAIGSGVVDIALGTDTGGSIRIPSSFCGCWGLKPTHGALPLDGVMPLAPSYDCPGPMARRASDLELLWRVLSKGRAVSLAIPARVGVLQGYFAHRVHPESAAAVERAAAAFEELGSEVVSVSGDGADDAAPLWIDVVSAELVASHPGLPARREELHFRTAGFVARGVTLLEDMPDDLAAARARAAELPGWLASLIEGARVDLLIAPTTPYPAPRAGANEVDVGGGESVDVHMGGTSIFTRPVSLAGNPALAVPAGAAGPGGFEGLPVSCQLIAAHDAESVLLAAALALEGSAAFAASPQPELPGA
jgi:aspartyl-tRNA(Asn)/glutamyl-tRNA(Gln) amidotransferase subunit A